MKATDACSGLRPVANALGDSSGYQPQLRHRQTHSLRQALYDRKNARVDFGVLGRGHWLSGVHRKRHFIGEEVSEEIHGYRDHQRDIPGHSGRRTSRRRPAADRSGFRARGQSSDRSYRRVSLSIIASSFDVWRAAKERVGREITHFAPLALIPQLLLTCTLIAFGLAISFLGRVTVNTPVLILRLHMLGVHCFRNCEVSHKRAVAALHAVEALVLLFLLELPLAFQCQGPFSIWISMSFISMPGSVGLQD